jgi:8-oxo-dGTP diphosphatase
LLTYPTDRDTVRAFVRLGLPRSTVLLVRHAKAGSRQQWDGPDVDRPLSGTGREQARHLAELLPLFGPDRFAGAPPVRCAQTVRPAADKLGLPVTDEPLLGEIGYAADPAAGLARFGELTGAPGVSVLCSQGGVIPHLVGALLAEQPSAPAPAELPARKGSTWVFTFRPDGTLRSADHYPDPAGR